MQLKYMKQTAKFAQVWKIGRRGAPTWPLRKTASHVSENKINSEW